MTKSQEESVTKIQAELARIGAGDAQVSLDKDFEPKSGPLAKLQIGDAYWHMIPADLLQLVEKMSDDAGSDAVRQAIEHNATTVWHGPAPDGSRDTSF